MALAAFSVLFLTLSVLPFCRAQERTQTCEYPGLFVSDQQLREITSTPDPSFDRLFELGAYEKVRMDSERCGASVFVRDTGRKAFKLTKCTASSYKHLLRKRATSTCDACCVTESSFSIPSTVTDLYTGNTYQAHQFSASYQLLNLGTCADPGTACGYQGTCVQATRIQWMLVSFPSGLSFVPTVVPSHCTCVYS